MIQTLAMDTQESVKEGNENNLRMTLLKELDFGPILFFSNDCEKPFLLQDFFIISLLRLQQGILAMEKNHA